MSRYIDADKLHYSRIRIMHEDGTIGGFNAVVMSAEIKDAPTADVEEVKHGKYINNNDTEIRLYTAECSCCNEITAMGLYCMWCGAKMDKEKEEDI